MFYSNSIELSTAKETATVTFAVEGSCVMFAVDKGGRVKRSFGMVKAIVEWVRAEFEKVKILAATEGDYLHFTAYNGDDAEETRIRAFNEACNARGIDKNVFYWLPPALQVESVMGEEEFSYLCLWEGIKSPPPAPTVVSPSPLDEWDEDVTFFVDEGYNPFA